MPHQIIDGLFQIKIDLPNSPLKNLNSYVLTSDDRNLIIDTGFNTPECLLDLQSGIKELGLDMEKTDVLATHFHSDHSGLISKIITKHSKVYMGEHDKIIFNLTIGSPEEYWKIEEVVFLSEGYPLDVFKKSFQANPARKLVSDGGFEIEPLDDGDKIQVGGRQLDVIATPGHTPGHICLYDAKNKLMLTGDHLLFDITPNITRWQTMPNSLGSYLDSLRKISGYEVERVLTGHRENEGIFKERIEELLLHHEKRLDDILNIVDTNPNSTGYEIASKMSWSIRAKNWEEFPVTQKWFAVGEALSHIKYLVIEKKLRQENINGINTYVLG